MAITLIEGKYLLEGKQFYVGSRKLVIKERKKGIESKPKKFLIALPFEYISSLFPVGERERGEAYHFDYQQELWKLEVREEVVHLNRVEPI